MVTVKSHTEYCPKVSSAENTTEVIPTGKDEPEAGTNEVMVGRMTLYLTAEGVINPLIDVPKKYSSPVVEAIA